MPQKRLVVINGHPDPSPDRFVHALATHYENGAISNNREVRRIDIAQIDFPLLRCRSEWEDGALARDILEAQDAIKWAEHLVIVYPLWLGDMPALLKAFLEQVLRPGFAFSTAGNGLPKKLLKGRSATVAVTMGMPALFYRAFYGAHSLKSFERNILRFVGIRPIRHVLIGNVESMTLADRTAWLERFSQMGGEGD
jgi:putative NADPH-quinone reductase